MRSVLVAIGLLLAGCASVRSDRIEPAAESTTSTSALRPVAAQTSPDHRPSDHPVSSETTETYGDASPAEAVEGTPDPVPMSTTTTVPGIDVDLSGLDGFVEGLDVLLGDLDMAMRQTEGEFTP